MRVYADNAATTKISAHSLAAMMPIYETVFGNPSSLHTVGQEAKEVLENADHELIIPMNPHCESLNAAIAAAIVMWEIRRN